MIYENYPTFEDLISFLDKSLIDYNFTIKQLEDNKYIFSKNNNIIFEITYHKESHYCQLKFPVLHYKRLLHNEFKPKLNYNFQSNLILKKIKNYLNHYYLY